MVEFIMVNSGLGKIMKGWFRKLGDLFVELNI